MSAESTTQPDESLSAEHSELLRRVRGYAFDAPEAHSTFAERLQRDNGWPSEFTARVIEEYRRFAFLSAASGHPVSPSDAVDQAWHLHLLYTRTYWDDFCKKVLQRPLHHEPANGAEGESVKLADWYTATLDSYRRFFGEPPADIWPNQQALRSRAKPVHQRVDTSQTFILPRRTVIAIVLVAAVLWIALVLMWVIRSERAECMPQREVTDESFGFAGPGVPQVLRGVLRGGGCDGSGRQAAA